MSKIVFGGFAAEVRNKLGGDVYQRGRGGNIIRTLGSYTDPKTAYQLLARAAWLATVERWNTITEGQRQTWRTFAAAADKQHSTFDGCHFSGQQWFNRLNGSAAFYGTAWIDDPPPDLHVTQPSALAIATLDVATQDFTVTWAPQAVDPEFYALFATAPITAGKHNWARLARFATSFDSADGTTKNIWDDYIAAGFPWPAVGDKIGLALKQQNPDNGMLSRPLITDAIAEAALGPNLVTNGDFQTGAIGAQAPSWTLATGNGLLITDDEYKHGARAGKTINTIAADSYNWAYVSLIVGATYELTGWIKTTAMPIADPGIGAALALTALAPLTGFTILYQNLPFPGPHTAVGILADDAPHNWTRLHQVVIPTGADGGALVACILGYNGNQSGTAWWDDVKLMRIA